MLKNFTLAIALLAVLTPSISLAASPTLSELQTQYQMLVEQFQTFKSQKSAMGSTTRSTKLSSTTVDRTCMAAAVATREASLKTAWTTFSNSITSALDDRAADLATAWNASETGNREASKSAWTDWKKAHKDATTKLKSERKTAWDAFKNTAKSTCKIETPKEEGLEKSGSDSIVL